MTKGIRVPDIVKEVTLSLDTNAYAANDVLADTQEITNVFPDENIEAILYSISLLDKDDQGGALDLVFLESNTSIGTENAALNLSDSAAERIVAVVHVSTGDYVDLINSQFVSKSVGDSGMGILIRPSDTSETSLYIAAISRGAKTYTASGITLKIGLLRG